MSDVIVFKGAVSFPITLDPSVWIFDERKFDLGSYQGETEDETSYQLKYLEGTGAQWDKELREGAVPPSERKSLIQERKALQGDYAIKLAPFIENARPLPEATHLRIHRENGESLLLPLSEAKRAILQFSKEGKPIRTDGPVYFYLPEAFLAQEPPITGITAFEIVSEN
ncbi:hypothetical protein NDK47_16160 [Brevibacillus ruminantium]|uniref:Peptidyl-prolyl cis-trans isomerase n=1 Tax=Brevibacillus ruminantium TaxID=2950604 RepID=A0ABY4W9I2_9BACL|nr:hypothetical protein [Brevibacillus ruminantium]USG63708.1 hypothetical protein NDK47_16160 [Brevibacillus ruminantium]